MQAGTKSTRDTCECCGRSDVIIAGVAASALGPMSVRYCPDCIVNDAEPLWVVEEIVLPEKDAIAPWVKRLTVYKDGKYVPIGSLIG